MNMSMSLQPVLTLRTRVIEFLRAPFGGTWLGEPGWLSSNQIAEGVGEPLNVVAEHLRRSKRLYEQHPTHKNLFRLRPPPPRNRDLVERFCRLSEPECHIRDVPVSTRWKIDKTHRGFFSLVEVDEHGHHEPRGHRWISNVQRKDLLLETT